MFRTKRQLEHKPSRKECENPCGLSAQTHCYSEKQGWLSQESRTAGWLTLESVPQYARDVALIHWHKVVGIQEKVHKRRSVH